MIIGPRILIEAAERRQRVAHGVSRGWRGERSQPRRGDRIFRPCGAPNNGDTKPTAHAVGYSLSRLTALTERGFDELR